MNSHSSLIDKYIQDPELILQSIDPNTHQHIPLLLIEIAELKQIDAFKAILNSPNLIDWSMHPGMISESKLSIRQLLDVSQVILKPSEMILEKDTFNHYDRQITDSLISFLHWHYTDLQGLSDAELPMFQAFTKLIMNYYIYHDTSETSNQIVEMLPSGSPLIDIKKGLLDTCILMHALKKGYVHTLQVVYPFMTQDQPELLFWTACVLDDLEKMEIMRLLSPQDIKYASAFIILLNNHHDTALKFLLSQVAIQDSKLYQKVKKSMNQKNDFTTLFSELMLHDLERLVVFGTMMDSSLVEYILKRAPNIELLKMTTLYGYIISGDLEKFRTYFSKENVKAYSYDNIKSLWESASTTSQIHILEYMSEVNGVSYDLVGLAMGIALKKANLPLVRFFIENKRWSAHATQALQLYLSLSEHIHDFCYSIITYLIDRLNQEGISPKQFKSQVNIDDIISKNSVSLKFFTQNHFFASLITPAHIMQLIDKALNYDKAYMANYVMKRQDLFRMLTEYQVETIYKKISSVFLVNNLESLERIYNTGSYDSNLGAKLIHVLQSSETFLEQVLSIKLHASSFDIFCFQHIALVATEIIKKHQSEPLKLILRRKELVDWNAGDIMKPINYPKHLLRPVDILEIVKVMYSTPSPDSIRYNDIQDDIKSLFSEFIKENLDSMASTHVSISIVSLWMDYLLFEGNLSDLELSVKSLSRLGMTNMFPRQTSIYLMLRMGHLNVIEMLLDRNVFSDSNLETLWKYSLYKQDTQQLQELLKRKRVPNSLQKQDPSNLINFFIHTLDYNRVKDMLSSTPFSKKVYLDMGNVIGETGNIKMMILLRKHLEETGQKLHDIMLQIVEQASIHGQMPLLKSIPNLLEYRYEMKGLCLSAIENQNNEVIDYFIRAVANDATDLHTLNTMIMLRNQPMSHILLSTIASETYFIQSSSWLQSVLLFRTFSDIQFLQFALHNYHLSKILCRQNVRLLIEFGVKNENVPLMKFILSETRLHQHLSVKEWLQYERDVYTLKNSALKKLFKTKGFILYRYHPELTKSIKMNLIHP